MPSVTFSGLASGIDADAVIKATLEARRLAAIPFENNRTFNTEQNNALEELRTKLLSIGDTLKEFMTLAGGALFKRATSSDTNAISVTAGNQALVSTTEVTVQQLARGATISFDDRFSSGDQKIAPDLATSANITFVVGSGDDARTFEIEVDSETTLSELSNRITAQTEGSVRASVINTGTSANPSYALVLQTATTGLEKGSLSITVDSEITATGALSSYSSEAAQDAIFSVTGIGQISRASNQVDDVIPGLTFELKQVTAGPVALSVSIDAEKTAKKFEEFVGSLNQLVQFLAENNKVERIEDNGRLTNVFMPLAKTRVDDRALQTIRSALLGTTNDGERQVRVLADLGLTIDRDGTYKFDVEKFVSQATADGIGTEGLLQKLADRISSAQGVLAEYTRFDGHIRTAIEANSRRNELLTEKLERMERSLEREAEMLRKIFTNLERTVSRLNNGANAITSLLALTLQSK